ncbi:TetR/AcrR family transcriptional regulator [Nocardia seriolae]|uniref:TetR family transcriptional regulator n=1 Tax=Nocardia seriolae TaxID=37332 RepID=A0A0B8N9Q4_9NOCA|nr:TetR/AcrR family transcriptional regulator [Nocardia seriolae]APA99272.1 Tetracycline repressor protein class [Nocardia seriolae]MTJ63333.1 TetR family transcriptional regulator [Nocardia seriolae]MTJ71210.1 TetR family transcriptional regulator [Nocardia seriolae]MTJ88865.1 TetR family transcriptional regulator [Nocardia seriolae]MTK32847.1 TetR family transcriptional regulator [Nocardia seriolae]
MTEAKLTRAAIVDTAIALADESGLDALSMRRIAERMNAGAMSLYRHVPNKDTLLAAMTDEVSRRNPYPPAEGRGWNWRDRVRIAAEVDWRLYQEHPWVLFTFAVPRYNFGEHSLIVLAWLVEGFSELGVDAREATRMSLAVWSYIAGVALQEVSARLLQGRDSNADERSGLTALLDGDPHWPTPPPLAGLAGTGDTALLNPEHLLETGLEALCDGFEARSAR